MPPPIVMRYLTDMNARQLVQLSQYAARSVWVQGPGGNTSVKNDDGCMWVKASGVFLGEVNNNAGWVQVHCQEITQTLKQEGLSGREADDLVLINNAVAGSLSEAAVPGLRPSMETAFHSLYQKYVLHTHNVFANIFLCSDQAEEIASCLPDPETCFSSLVNDYYTPGAELSWVLYDLFRFSPSMPQITLLPNHGIIVAADSLEELVAIHDQFHAQLCIKLNLTDNDYPGFSIHPDGNGFVLTCAYLEEYFADAGTVPAVFSNYLVPDLAVYLYPGHYSATNEHAKVYFNPLTRSIRLNTGRKEAITLAELMINGVFLHEQITRRGFEPLTINFDADKLRNMGSEKHRRKSLEE